MEKRTPLHQKILDAARGCDWCRERVLVFGEGNPYAELVLVGEAPGRQEEEQQRPFVGSAGKNLDGFLKVLERNRDALYITNVVKIRPYKLSPKTQKAVNRTPNAEEIQFFTPFLREELALIGPRVVATMGNTALRAVSDLEKETIGQVHGQALPLRDFILFPLYHPASVIYDRSLAAIYQEDLLRLRKLMNGR